MRACNLAKPCVGRPLGFLVQARQRLLLGLHPSSRVPLDHGTVPEPGARLPPGYDDAVCLARRPATTAALPRKRPLPHGETPPRVTATPFVASSARPHPPWFLAMRRPKTAQEASKTPPRRLQNASKMVQDASKDALDRPRRPKTLPNLPRSLPDLDFGRFLIDVWSIFDRILIGF